MFKLYKNKQWLIIVCILSNLSSANDSFYTKTKDEKVIEESENYVSVKLKSPKGYSIIVRDAGCMVMSLEVEKYQLTTAQIPNVIEWRMDDKKKIIGAIVRTYERIYDEKLEFSEGKFSSILNVLYFDDKTILIGTSKTNSEARELLDAYGGVKK